MAPWFTNMVGQIESLSMDARADRERLFIALMANLPRERIRIALSDHIEEWLVRVGGMHRSEVEEVIQALSVGAMLAAVTALEES